MKISDLEHQETIDHLSNVDHSVSGGIEIGAATFVLTQGSKFAFSVSLAKTFAISLGPF